MAVRNIVLYPDAPLLQRAASYDEVTPDLALLAEDMIETMHAYDGVGLAGPQIGLPWRIFVMHEPDREPRCIINPEILEREGEEFGEEGCLSIPRVYAQVPRSTRLVLRGLDERGKKLEFEAVNFAARIIQHEIDHLDGICFPDRLDILTREEKLREWEQLRAEMAEAIRTA
jgi:peptide deformylase